MSEVFGIRVVPVTVAITVIMALGCVAFLGDLGGAVGQHIIFARSAGAPAVASEGPGGSPDGGGFTSAQAMDDVGEEEQCDYDMDTCTMLDEIDESFEAIQTALE